MSPARRIFVLAALGITMLVLAVTVYVRNRRPDDDMLATIGILGALAVFVTNLPTDRK